MRLFSRLKSYTNIPFRHLWCVSLFGRPRNIFGVRKMSDLPKLEKCEPNFFGGSKFLVDMFYFSEVRFSHANITKKGNSTHSALRWFAMTCTFFFYSKIPRLLPGPPFPPLNDKHCIKKRYKWYFLVVHFSDFTFRSRSFFSFIIEWGERGRMLETL